MKERSLGIKIWYGIERRFITPTKCLCTVVAENRESQWEPFWTTSGIVQTIRDLMLAGF